MAQPKVTSATNAPFPTTVEVHFDSSMLNDDDLNSPGNYLFNNGAYTTSVLVSDNTMFVTLIVQNLFEYDGFTVTVQNVKNASSEVIDPSFNSGSFTVVRPNVPGFVLAISATNGRLKSGIYAVKIDRDTGRWYVLTESGVDIVDRDSLINTGFILEKGGFNAIHVSGD